MTGPRDSRIRELLGRAGDQVPSLPTFEELETGAAVIEPGRPNTLPRPVVFIVAVIIVGLGIGLAWQTQRDGSSDVVTVGDQTTSSAEVVSAWADGAWPVLPAEEGLQLEYALADPPEMRVVGYRTSAGGQVWLAVVAPRPGDEPLAPSGTVVDIAGVEGSLETFGEGNESIVRVSWERDGLRFFVDAEDLSPEKVVMLAESIRPVAGSELPVPVISTSPGDGEPFTAATIDSDGEAQTLTATTTDGLSFFLQVDSDGDGEGPYFLVGDDLIQVMVSPSPDGSLLAGIVSQTVADLALRMTDGRTQPIEIQSRDLGYDVAFFLAGVDDLSQLEAVEAYDTEGTVIDTESFSD